MTVPVLEFFTTDWLEIPAQVGSIQFRLVALPPVAASAGIIVFAKRTNDVPGQPNHFAAIGKANIDNIPETLASQGFNLTVQQGIDYVIRVQGGAHLLMPGFNSVTVGFNLASAAGPISNLGGERTASNTRSAGINGDIYLRCV